MSNVSIKLLRKGAKLPTRGSAFAAGYDLYACLDGDKELIIPPHATAMLPTGLSFALPEGTFGAVVARSGLASKQGLRPAKLLLQLFHGHVRHASVAIAMQANLMTGGNHFCRHIRILLHAVTAEEKRDMGFPLLQFL